MPSHTTEMIVAEPQQALQANWEAKLANHVKLLDEALARLQKSDQALKEAIAAKNMMEESFFRKERLLQERCDSLSRLLDKTRSTKFQMAAEASQKHYALEQDLASVKKELERVRWELNNKDEIIRSKENENDSLSGKILAIEESYKRISCDMQRLKSEDEDFRRSVQEKNNQHDREKIDSAQKILILEKDKNDLEEKLKKQTIEIENYQKKQIHLYVTEKQLSEALRAISSKDSTIKDLTEKLQNICLEMDELQNKINPKKIIQTRVVGISGE